MLTTRVSRCAIRVLAFVTIPLCMVSCAGSQNSTRPAAELRAATDSDLLNAPAELVYKVTDVDLVAPESISALGKSLEAQAVSEGYMVMQDGVITEAEFSMSVAGISEASFVLTEPTVLPREGREDPVVYASGTLAVDGIEQRSAQLKLTPGIIDDTTAEFDISFPASSALLAAGGATGLSEMSAHISLAAQ